VREELHYQLAGLGEPLGEERVRVDLEQDAGAEAVGVPDEGLLGEALADGGLPRSWNRVGIRRGETALSLVQRMLVICGRNTGRDIPGGPCNRIILFQDMMSVSILASENRIEELQ
jgi:hypothetical protein